MKNEGRLRVVWRDDRGNVLSPRSDGTYDNLRVLLQYVTYGMIAQNQDNDYVPPEGLSAETEDGAEDVPKTKTTSKSSKEVPKKRVTRQSDEKTKQEALKEDDDDKDDDDEDDASEFL